MSSLEVLNLDSRDIGDNLKCLRKLPLKSLDLFSSRVTVSFGLHFFLPCHSVVPQPLSLCVNIGSGVSFSYFHSRFCFHFVVPHQVFPLHQHSCLYLSEIKTLTSLELCGGSIGDLGCAHIATITNLTSLNLSQNGLITNRGASSLAALVNLKALNLGNTSVDSDALKFFTGLLKLQSLALYGNDTENSPRLTSLQNELPSLRCLRLNSSWNEDGVIETEYDKVVDDEEDKRALEDVDSNIESDHEPEGAYGKLYIQER